MDKKSEEIYNIVIRVLPEGIQFDAEIPINTTGQEIIDFLLDFDEINATRYNRVGDKINYKLLFKNTGKEIKPNMSLSEADIKDGDSIIIFHSEIID